MDKQQVIHSISTQPSNLYRSITALYWAENNVSLFPLATTSLTCLANLAPFVTKYNKTFRHPLALIVQHELNFDIPMQLQLNLVTSPLVKPPNSPPATHGTDFLQCILPLSAAILATRPHHHLEGIIRRWTSAIWPWYVATDCVVNNCLSSGCPSAQLSCNKSVSLTRLTCHSVLRAWDAVGWWADTVTCTDSPLLQLNAGMSEQLLLLLQSPPLFGQWCRLTAAICSVAWASHSTFPPNC